ncbi:PPOX class F420-dependent oxidoreductase [Streptomyces geranii]|uniref:PPOX class F420-dependent oxidoreductase n=1 Tax=Streptomyces geranii TaxID=2058923 RepID=UPI000D039900|nr:PPOX class F420-dependent oxidoreductase [Streptomyces geranii]
MRTTPPSPGLAPFVKQWAVLLTSHRKDGSGVGTPVNIVVEGDHAYFRTPANAWKTGRLRDDPTVEIAPCTARGAPTGPEVHAHARLLDHGGPEDRHAASLLRRKYPVTHGVLAPLAHRVMGTPTLHYELRVREEQAEREVRED